MTLIKNLKCFEYEIPTSTVVDIVKAEANQTNKKLPLLSTVIDFEKGKFSLEGDWQFMVKSNHHNSAKCLIYHGARVKIETTVFPNTSIDLNAEEADGLVLPMEGLLNDGLNNTNVTGLLIIDNKKTANGERSNQWYITLYIYDYLFDVCEIKFQFPLLVSTVSNAHMN